jgi:phage shock protein PspC (stress-responsive transcriptional regulator)
MVDGPAKADAVVMNSTTNNSNIRRFQRSRDDKVISGVAGGLGKYFDVDPVLFRVGIVAATIMTGGLVALAYIGLAIARDYDDAPAAPPAVTDVPQDSPTPVAA